MKAIQAGVHTAHVGTYCMEKIPGLLLTPGMFSAMMVVSDDNDFMAGVVFTNFRTTDGKPTDIEISCASETPAAWRPEVVQEVFKYVFEFVGCVRCTSITTKSNKKARGFLEGLGFQLEGNVRLGYDGTRDALIYGLLRSECRFLAGESEREDGEEERSDSAPGTGPGSDGPGPSDGEQGRGGNASELEPD